MRVGSYFARAIAGWFFALTVLMLGLAMAWSAVLPMPRSGVPAPWALMGPLFFVACFITWCRASRTGELCAAAASGVARRSIFGPVALVGLGLQISFCLPRGQMPVTRVADTAVQRSVDGDLFVVHGDGGVRLWRDGRLHLLGSVLPADFKPAPHNPRRYRRQAFFTRAPRWSSRDRFDPWLWRFVYAFGVIVLPSILMTTQRARAWWLGCVPLVVPLAIL